MGRPYGKGRGGLGFRRTAPSPPRPPPPPRPPTPATIAAELGEAPAGGPHYQSLFLLGVVLFFITLIINSSVEYISAKNRK